MGLEYLYNRRIALLGLGLENRALARFLYSKGISFSVCDAREPADLEVFQQECGEAVEEWHLGATYLDSLSSFEVIFRTPGISALHPALKSARARGARVTSQTRIFAELCPAPILGVTGTKGKGTTVSLIAEILRGRPGRRLYLGGNIGLPPIAFLDEVKPDDLVVLELSSFQLMDWDRSPSIALVLGIAQDHLDYHASLEEYVEAKRAIARYQKADDYLIVNQDCQRARRFAEASQAQILAFSTTAEVARGSWVEDGQLWLRRLDGTKEWICPTAEIPLRGRHHQANAAAAAAAAAVAGAERDWIAAGLRRFSGLEHRLERVGEFGGVAYYNDSLATTPESAIAALEAFDEPVILIAGGSSKGADFAALGATIARRRVKAVILIGQEAPRLQAAIEQAGNFTGELVMGCTSMAAAVAAARARARPGEVVLLSPACASFDLFSNYRERGEEFKRLVRAAGNSAV